MSALLFLAIPPRPHSRLHALPLVAFDRVINIISYKTFPKLECYLLVRHDLAIPPDIQQLHATVHIITTARQVPSYPCVVIADAAKWSWSGLTPQRQFTCQIVDEAYQLPEHRYIPITNLAERVILPTLQAPWPNSQPRVSYARTNVI